MQRCPLSRDPGHPCHGTSRVLNRFNWTRDLIDLVRPDKKSTGKTRRCLPGWVLRVQVGGQDTRAEEDPGAALGRITGLQPRVEASFRPPKAQGNKKGHRGKGPQKSREVPSRGPWGFRQNLPHAHPPPPPRPLSAEPARLRPPGKALLKVGERWPLHGPGNQESFVLGKRMEPWPSHPRL